MKSKNNKYLIAIDLGTTTLKVAVFKPNSEFVSSGSIELIILRRKEQGRK